MAVQNQLLDAEVSARQFDDAATMPVEARLAREDAGSNDRTVIIGAGPAGLTAAWELTRNGRSAIVLEQDPTHVGGIARTVSYKGFRFDIGGHRFFSKNAEIEKLWSEILGDQMLERDRLSRIYYRGRFFKYPLETLNVLQNLGIGESIACMFSYATAKVMPSGEIKSFEDWVVSAFGRRLYEIFFRSYTEKVWGIPCNEISADWAAQRIKDLSISSLVKRAFTFRKKTGAAVIKTLIDRFRYPAHGPGEMWEVLTKKIEERGATVQMGESVVSIKRGSAGVISIGTTGPNGARSYAGKNFISTMAVRELVAALDPVASAEVVAAANSLKYRDFITVALIIDQADMFPDNWIYIHEPGVKVGRIQNFKNWSPAMVPDSRYTVLGLEYFCFDSDSMWSTPDADLIATGARELAQLGLGDAAKVVDGTVVRQRAAYPVYDAHYRDAVEVVRGFIERELPNLQLAGRNGMHKYNNQDHAMMTGLMAAWNIMGGSYDLWRVNGDALYLEAGAAGDEGGRMVPRPLSSELSVKAA
jgi:protoporphyrinogen oxidase